MTITTSNKTTSITTWPDRCLLTVFDSVPLTELINVLLTCPRFNSLRPRILGRRTRLHLKVGKQGPSNNHDQEPLSSTNNNKDSVWCSVLSVSRLNQLYTALSEANIREVSLEVDIASYLFDPSTVTVSLASFSQLLLGWADKPIQTVIWSSPPPDFEEDSQSGRKAALLSVPLMKAISELNLNGSLQVLKLDYWLLEHYVTKRVPFPVLARLRLLETNCPEGGGDRLVEFCNWLGDNLDGNDRLEVFFPAESDQSMQSSRFSLNLEYQFEQILHSGAPLAAFTGWFPEPNAIMGRQIDFEEDLELGFDHLHRFLGHFSRLTQFSLLNWDTKLTFSEMTRALAQLPELTDLQWLYPREFSDHFDLNPSPVPLPSVRRATVRLYDTICLDHMDLEPSKWAKLPHALVFPGLEQLRLVYSGYQFMDDDYDDNDDSDQDETEDEEEDDDPLPKGIRPLIEPYLRGCDQLAQVFFHDIAFNKRFRMDCR